MGLQPTKSGIIEKSSQQVPSCATPPARRSNPQHVAISLCVTVTHPSKVTRTVSHKNLYSTLHWTNVLCCIFPHYLPIPSAPPGPSNLQKNLALNHSLTHDTILQKGWTKQTLFNKLPCEWHHHVRKSTTRQVNCLYCTQLTPLLYVSADIICASSACQKPKKSYILCDE